MQLLVQRRERCPDLLGVFGVEAPVGRLGGVADHLDPVAADGAQPLSRDVGARLQSARTESGLASKRSRGSVFSTGPGSRSLLGRIGYMGRDNPDLQGPPSASRKR